MKVTKLLMILLKLSKGPSEFLVNPEKRDNNTNYQ